MLERKAPRRTPRPGTVVSVREMTRRRTEAGEEKRLTSHTLTPLWGAPAWLLDGWCPEGRNAGAETKVGEFRHQATFR